MGSVPGFPREARRIRPAAAEFVRVALYELDVAGRAPTWEALADAVGLSPEALSERINSGRKADLEEVVRRWDAHAETHPPIARLIVLDHPDDTEIALGHPLRPDPAFNPLNVPSRRQ